MEKQKYLWYTDIHLDKKFPWTIFNFIRYIIKENPEGVFLTGDISNGLLTCFHLRLMATFIKCPIYFVLGNHDLHFTNIEKQHDKIRALCKIYSNLIWMTESDVIPLNDEVALIGIEGWYDAKFGRAEYLVATMDWFMTEDFRKLPNMEKRVDAFRALAKESANNLEIKIKKALKRKFKTIYVLTHFPPWKEATRDEGTLLEEYFLPYNINFKLGEMIEKIMLDHKTKNITILCGHTHHPEYVRVSRNINCQVGDAKLFNINSQKIYL